MADWQNALSTEDIKISVVMKRDDILKEIKI